MRNVELWKPSKFVPGRRGLRASRDEQEVIRSSRFIADRLAGVYSDLLERHARGRLLDVGCGKVPLFGVYRSLVEEVTCVDWDQSLHANSHLDLVHDLNTGIPLPPDSFDTVIATDVLEHIARPDVLFASMAGVLAPAGKLLVTVPFLYGLHEIPYDFHRYTEYRLRLFCVDNGLDVIELEPYGGALEVRFDITARLLGGSRVLSALHLALAGGITRSWIGRKARSATARKFPLGYALVAQKPSEAAPAG